MLRGDRLGMQMPPPSAFSGNNASPGGIFAGFLDVMQGIFNQLAGLMRGLTGQAPGGEQPYFSNAELSSTGDPHEAVNATTGAGQQINAKWDNMHSHAHLLTSNGIAGGFNLATCASAPNANGATYNEQARLTTNNGNTIVTMDKGGAYGVIDNGKTVSLQNGIPVTVGCGETLTLNANGVLSIDLENAQGGKINTTLSPNENGVDVNVAASDVTLGGYLVSASSQGQGAYPA